MSGHDLLPQSPFEALQLQLPRRVGQHLARGTAAFFWSKGAWMMRPDRTSKAATLSAEVSRKLDVLRSSGFLFEGPPGFFRGQKSEKPAMLNDRESPLAWLAVRRRDDGALLIEPEQLEAGERLRRDFERAGLSARVTVNYEPRSGAGRQGQFSDNPVAALSDGALDARRRLHLALEAVGPELAGILYHVCCLAGGIEQAELRLNLPRRAGRAVLQLALTRLARHYRLKPPLRHAGPGNIGHWAAEGFRPEITPTAPHQP